MLYEAIAELNQNAKKITNATYNKAKTAERRVALKKMVQKKDEHTLNMRQQRQRRTKKQQRGGQAHASSCAAKSDLSQYMASHCSQANLHNTNPEAGDLDMAQGAGFLPGLRGGAAEPITFDEYKNAIRAYLGGKADQFGGSKRRVGGRKLRRGKTKRRRQAGGTYYSINPEEMIGGLARVDKGDSCCQGAILGGKFMQGDGAICGNQMGGRRRTRRRGGKKHQRGGSRPAEFPSAFDTEAGDFSADAEGKDFGCAQPWWGPSCR